MSRPVFDDDGNPVLCQEAVAKRDALIQQLGSLPPVQSALDQIVHRFGHDAVAEVMLNARESSQAQRDTIKELRRQVRSLERQVARKSRELEEAEGRRQVIRELSGENTELRAELRELRDQSATIEWLRRRVAGCRGPRLRA